MPNLKQNKSKNSPLILDPRFQLELLVEVTMAFNTVSPLSFTNLSWLDLCAPGGTIYIDYSVINTLRNCAIWRPVCILCSQCVSYMLAPLHLV